MKEENRRILATLILGVSSIDTPSLIVGMSLIEIATAFGVSIGLAGQIRSFSSSIAIVVSLLVAALSVRYSYKSLLLAGLLINISSAVLCAVAPSFTILVICFSAIGIVTSLVSPMVFTYIGEIYPVEERSNIVGTVASLRTVIYLVMVQLIGLIVSRLGWRYTFLILAAPMTLLAIILVYRGMPVMRSSASGDTSLLEGYGNVLKSRSALSCLLGNLLAGGAWAGGIVSYSMTYLRDDFGLSISKASSIFSGLVIGVLIGNYIGGRLASRIGTKRLVVVSVALNGIFTVAYMSISNVAAMIVFCGLTSLVAGFVLTCANTLMIGQLPEYRGTVTSLNSAGTQLGIVFGSALGGILLTLASWRIVGVAYGVMMVAAALIYQLGVRE